jgi:hypothetical protein
MTVKRGPGLQLRFHDLRATGISWLAMLPLMSQFDIRDYAGHTEISTTDLYVRRGRKARGSVGEPFPRLPASLLGESITDSITPPAIFTKYLEKCSFSASPTGFEPVSQP